MVSYEQNYNDYYGTLALKNNTSETIQNVTFLITYFDMLGRDIEPGKTRKIDIDAYEHRRFYNYYKSEGYPFSAHPFKIKFELKEYNSDKALSDLESQYSLGAYDTESNIYSGIGNGMTMLIAIVAGMKHYRFRL